MMMIGASRRHSISLKILLWYYILILKYLLRRTHLSSSARLPQSILDSRSRGGGCG